jgi:hypothetical protein
MLIYGVVGLGLMLLSRLHRPVQRWAMPGFLGVGAYTQALLMNAQGWPFLV